MAGANSPHDGLFRFTFAKPEHAVPLLRAVLPPEVSCAIDWSTLTPLPETHVDARLRRSHRDLLFRVRSTAGPRLLYAVVEHKRSPDRWAVLQLLRYVIDVWLQLRLEGRRHLPRVLPILVLQRGKEAAMPATLSGLFDPVPADGHEVAVGLDRWQPQFSPLLVSLDGLSVAARQGVELSLLAQLTVDALVRLPGADTETVALLLRDWAPSFAELLREVGGGASLEALWSYCLQVTVVPVKELIDIVEQVMDPTVARKLLSPLQQLLEMGRKRGIAAGVELGIAEGRERGLSEGREQGLSEGREQGLSEGREQGLSEGRVQLLGRLLESRFGALPSHLADRLGAATTAQLDAWALRVLTATSLDEVFGG